jgi:hypothetical protein
VCCARPRPSPRAWRTIVLGPFFKKHLMSAGSMHSVATEQGKPSLNATPRVLRPRQRQLLRTRQRFSEPMISMRDADTHASEPREQPLGSAFPPFRKPLHRHFPAFRVQRRAVETPFHTRQQVVSCTVEFFRLSEEIGMKGIEAGVR